MKTKIICQVHDSVDLSIPPQEVEDVFYLCHEIMTKKLAKLWEWLIVPLEIEAELSPEGGSWYDKTLVSPMVPKGNEHLIWDKEDKKWLWM